jgi:hypothetical protein
VIEEVNGEHIAETRDLERITGVPSRLWKITVRRHGQTMSVAFQQD